MKVKFQHVQIIISCVAFLFFVVSIGFELPIVQHARSAVPKIVYAGAGECDCVCISNSRPAYSTFNPWTWFWITIVPLMVFLVRPSDPKWKRTWVNIAAISLCYIFMNWAVATYWDIKNDPFNGLDFSFTGGKSCVYNSGGASLGLTLVLGWIPASLYTLFWVGIRWGVYRFIKRKSVIKPVSDC